MWDWVIGNKDWFLSGLGIALFGLLVWAFRIVYSHFKTAPKVQVVLAYGAVPGLQGAHYLCIKIVNPPAGRILYLGNFMLAMILRQKIYVKQDELTGAAQRPQSLQPGKSASFHIAATTLKEINMSPESYAAAIVEDESGCTHRSTRKDIRKAVGLLLSSS